MSSEPLFLLEREGAEALPLPAGRHVLGAQAALVLDAPGVAPQHLVLTVAAERVFCEARSPQLSFEVAGQATRSLALVDGDRLRVGEVELCLRRVVDSPTSPLPSAAPARPASTELIHAREEQSTLAQHYARVISGASANVRQLDLFYRLSQLVSSFGNIERFGDQLLELVLDVIPGRRAFLVLAGDGPPEVLAARPAEQREPGPSKTILERVLGEGVSLITADAQHDPRFSDSASIVIGAIRTALCAPLRADDQVLGAIYVDASDGQGPSGKAPTAEHLTLLESVASYAALALSRARAYAALRQRELHAHLLVHDLKNPLSNVLAGTDFLETLLPEEARGTVAEVLQLIRSSSARLEGYISDILAVAQLEESGVTPQRQEHDIADFAEALAARWRNALELRRLRLAVEVEPSSRSFAFDGRLIDRVIDNLLDNAVQHAPSESALAVRFELRPSGDGESLHVAVHDEGPGVPEALRERVFDKFARVESKGVGGRGFGLYFCRLAVRAHGGEIAVHGEPGANRFTFTLAAPGDPR